MHVDILANIYKFFAGAPGALTMSCSVAAIRLFEGNSNNALLADRLQSDRLTTLKQVDTRVYRIEAR